MYKFIIDFYYFTKNNTLKLTIKFGYYFFNLSSWETNKVGTNTESGTLASICAYTWGV